MRLLSSYFRDPLWIPRHQRRSKKMKETSKNPFENDRLCVPPWKEKHLRAKKSGLFFRCQSKGDGARVQSAPDCWRTRLSCKRRTQARLSSQKKQLGRRRRGQHMSRTQDVCSRVVEVKSSNWHMMPEEMKETPLGSRAQGKEKKESMSSPPSRYGYRSSAQCSCCTLRWEIVVRFVAEIFCWSSYYCTRGSRKWTVFAIFVMHAFANVGRKEILRQTSISGC